MSPSIDERVVSMEFDNSQFESNVKTSLGTIDKLKQSLNFGGASKGLENIGSAAKNVDMSTLNSGVEAVRLRFSALEVMAVTALGNITNSAVNAGKKIVSALTIDPIKTGFNEYETKINAIQTIMSNTASKGTTMADVTRVIDELNTYADKTIYNFAEMTKNIGTFTAAGVGLEDSAAAIQGIANLAAASGSNSQKASVAMYQLSQALAAGTVKLMDWNSVVNAGMGGEKFQNALKQTAREMGIAVDDIIKKNGSFRESLSDGWITADVLNTTLKKFTTEGAAEYVDAMLKAGKYTEEQANALKKEAESMEDAATKVKTFTQLWDTLKESVQSGWGKTWELVIGNFEQAKEALTGISELLTGEDSFLTKSANARNNFIETTLGSNWDKLIAKLGKAGIEADKFDKSLRNTLEDNGHDVDNIIDKFGSLEKAFTSGEIKADILREAIANIGKTTKKLDFSKVSLNTHLWDANEGVKQVQQALKDLGYDLGEFGVDGKFGKETYQAVMAFQRAAGIQIDGIVGEETIAALKEATASTKELKEENKVLVDSYDDLISTITETSGRELLMDSLKNVLEGLMKVLGTVRDAWWSIFAVKPKSVYNFIKGLNQLTKKLVLSDDTADKLKRTLQGLFSILNIITTITGGGLKIAFKTLGAILGDVDIGFLDIAASIGDTLVAFRDNVSETVDVVTDTIVDGVSNWIDEFKNTELFKTVSGYFDDAGKKITEVIDDINEKIEKFEVSEFMTRLQAFGSFLSKIATTVANNEFVVAAVDRITSAFTKLVNFIRNIKLPEFNINNLTSLTKIFSSFEGAGSLTEGITELGNYFKGIGSFKWETFANNALQKFVTFWLKVGDKAKLAFEKCKEVAIAIKNFLFGTEEVNLPVIMDAVTKFLSIVALIKVIKLLDTIVSPFDNISDALNNFATSLKWEAIGAAFKSMALALGVLTACIVIIAQMDVKNALAAAGILLALMAVMGGIVIALGVISSKMDGGINTAGAVASLLMMVVSLMLLVKTIKDIDNLQLKNPAKTFGTLFLTLLALSSGVKMIAKAGGSSFKSVAAILTMMAALKLMLEVIDDYDKFDWSDKSGAIKKMVTMLFTLAAAINIASRGVKSGASSKGLAFTLIAMVVSLKILLSVIKDFAAMGTEEIIKGGLVVFALLGFMTAMLAVVNLTSNGTVLQKGERSVNNFAGLAMALLAVVAAIWLLGKMDLETLKQGGIAVAGILAAFTVMLGVVGKSCSGLKMGSVIAMLAMFGLLMGELAFILHSMKGIPLEQSLGSAAALSGVLLAMSFALRSLTKYDVSSGNIYKWVGAMALLGLIVAGLGFVLASMKNIEPGKALANAAALGILLGAMSLAMLTLTKYDVSSGNIYKWVGAMIPLGLVIAGLAFILYSIKSINPGNAIGAATALGILLAAMSGIMIILNKAPIDGGNIMRWIGALAGLGLVVYGLTYVLSALKDVDPSAAIGNATALGILLAAMSGVLAVISMIKFDWGSFKGILGLAAVALALAGVVAILAQIKNIDTARQNAITLANLAVALGICMIALEVAGLKKNAALSAAVSLAAVAYALSGVVAILGQIKSVETARQNAITLANLVAVLSVCMIALEVAGLGQWAAAIGAACLIVVAYALSGVVAILGQIKSAETARENAITLANLVAVLSACMVALAVAGLAPWAPIAGAVALVIVAASMSNLVNELSKIEGVDKASANADTLVKLLKTMTETMVQISSLGAMSLVSAVAMNSLINLVKRLAVFITTIGAITTTFPSLEKFMDSGIELFKKLANGIGEIISAFGIGATSGLGEIGENLSAFMDKATPFLESVNTVDEGVVTGAGNLSKAVLALIGAGFVNELASFDGDALSKLGNDLSNFSDNISGFLTAMGEMKPETATGVEALCSAILAISEANLVDTLTNLFPGDNSLATFGSNIESFAAAIQNASTLLNNITDEDVSNITKAAEAGSALAELNKAIPTEGGLWDKVFGSNDFANWGSNIEAFATSLISVSEKLSAGPINSSAIQNAATAAGYLADLNNSVPTEGGLWDKLVGSNDIATWGSSIDAFATSLVSVSSKLSSGTIDTAAIQNAATAAGYLADLNKAIPTQGGIWDAIAGGQDMGVFGRQLVGLGTGLGAYATAVATIDDTKMQAIEDSKTAMTKIIEVISLLTNEGGLFNFDWLFGKKDGESFGTALSSMARGIADYCTAASTINEESITAIQNSGRAVTALGEVMALVPEVGYSSKATDLGAAVSQLSTFCSTINTMSETGYNYSSIGNIKIAVGSLSTMFEGVDAAQLSTDASSLLGAIATIATAASRINTLSSYDYSGVDSFIDAMSKIGEMDIDTVIASFAGKAGSMATAVNSLIAAMVSAIGEGTTTVSHAMSDLTTSMLDAVSDKDGDAKGKGEGLVSALASGINDDKGEVESAGSSVAGKAISGAETNVSGMTAAGVNLGRGLVNGMAMIQGAVYYKGFQLGSAAVSGVNDGLDTHSPSKLTYKSGIWTGEGLINGLVHMGKRVYRAGSSMGKNAIGGISKSIRRVTDLVESDIDTQPTIRPVMDLSNVSSGMDAIRSMFGGQPTLGANPHLGAITSMMGVRQNGANDEVISAIRDLNSNLERMGNTYNINGVTYDDGSNIRGAVEAIMREARIARRV